MKKMSLTGIRYTKGFLLDLRRRLEFIKDAHELLEMKRDQLIIKLREGLEKLKELRRKVEGEAEEVYRELSLLHSTLGSADLETYSAYLRGNMDVKIVPRGVIGVVTPMVREVNIPDYTNLYPPQIIPLAEKISALMKDLVKLAELEAYIENLAEDLRRTNIRVNALEKVVIPSYEWTIKRIQDILDDEMLEEIIRLKLIKETLTRRRIT
ncbi:MAG: V-type ATP synthase subunit D [Thaumarchaeota archaeon]|nr:V-type ATP synthase subunit D [Nitrososphaerota archaeon]